MWVLEVEQGERVDRVAGAEAGRDGVRLAAERKCPVTSAPAEIFSTVDVKHGRLEERVGGAEAERDGVDFQNE